MPVKRRKAKRIEVGRYDDWEQYLATGEDMFRDLRWAGLVAPGEKPPDDLSEAAWRRYGAQVIDDHGPRTWGARRFGEP